MEVLRLLAIVVLACLLLQAGGGCGRDGDVIFDNLDSCPDAPNPTQTDSDGHGVGDGCVATCGSTRSKANVPALLKKYRDRVYPALPGALPRDQRADGFSGETRRADELRAV